MDPRYLTGGYRVRIHKKPPNSVLSGTVVGVGRRQGWGGANTPINIILEGGSHITVPARAVYYRCELCERAISRNRPIDEAGDGSILLCPSCHCTFVEWQQEQPHG